jgi:hypothetical protein
MSKTKNGKAAAAKTVKVAEAVHTAVPAGTETKAKAAEAKAEAKPIAKPAKEKVDKEAKIQGQVDANAAAILKAHDEGKSVKELYKMFGINKGLFCDLVYVVLWKAGRLRLASATSGGPGQQRPRPCDCQRVGQAAGFLPDDPSPREYWLPRRDPPTKPLGSGAQFGKRPEGEAHVERRANG